MLQEESNLYYFALAQNYSLNFIFGEVYIQLLRITANLYF